MTTIEADAVTTSAILSVSHSAQWTPPSVTATKRLVSDAEQRSPVDFSPSIFGWIGDVLALLNWQPWRRSTHALSGTYEKSSQGTWFNPVQAIGQVRDADVRNRAIEIVARVRHELSQIDVSALPPINVSVDGDGAFLVEWTIGRRRIGLNVERNAAESSWYFVSFAPPASASGTMSELDLRALIRRVLP